VYVPYNSYFLYYKYKKVIKNSIFILKTKLWSPSYYQYSYQRFCCSYFIGIS